MSEGEAMRGTNRKHPMRSTRVLGVVVGTAATVATGWVWAAPAPADPPPPVTGHGTAFGLYTVVTPATGLRNAALGDTADGSCTGINGVTAPGPTAVDLQSAASQLNGDPGFRVNFIYRDGTGGVHTYIGRVDVTGTVISACEDIEGTYTFGAGQMTPPVAGSGFGRFQSLTVAGTSPGVTGQTSLTCTYTSGGTYIRVGARLNARIEFDSCTIKGLNDAAAVTVSGSVYVTLDNLVLTGTGQSGLFNGQFTVSSTSVPYTV